METLTRPEPDDDEASPPRRTDHLYLALGAGAAGGARWALDGIDVVDIGRGAARAVRRDGRTLRVDCPDPWMSSAHLRLERERGHWLAVDAGSRNGILVAGVRHPRTVVGDRDVIEAGRSCFLLRRSERAGAAAVDLVPAPGEARPLTLDPELGRDLDELARVSAARVPVLIGGPTGAGKERIARAIHAASGRRGPLVPVNCGALPAGLVESELFGHKRGAFSGALQDHAGLITASSGGTLFLDEIGDLPPPAQAALLRVLEEHEVRPVGATAAVPVDLRVVAATHRDLDAMIAGGHFRDDLFARLSGFTLELPPLAERTVDLGLLIAALVPAKTVLAAATARALFAYSWPRNVRELARVLERAVALAAGGELKPAHLPDEIAQATFAPPGREQDDGDARRAELVRLLALHRGNVSRIAADLGRARQQVQRWLKRYGLDPARYR
jgi:transcriptional regulator of acetoin/glycerol metabolism